MRFSELSLLVRYDLQEKKPVLIDVGAHRGSFALRFVKKGWSVVAFEPERVNFASLKTSLENYAGAILINKAVSNVTGEFVPFYVSETHYGIHSLKPFHFTHKSDYEVETVRLDDALEDLAIDSVTLLKIDVEGADFLALKSLDLKRFNPEIVMVEFMDERSKPIYKYTHHDIVMYMNELNYAAYISEWAPIVEYGREDSPTEPHVWLQCVPYPLDHEPAWGNLIFIPATDEEKFRGTLSAYLDELKRQATFSQTILGRTKKQVRRFGVRIPGAKKVYRRIKR